MSARWVFFSAGEASGDAYGAELATQIKRIGADCELTGLGGNRMERAGIKLIGSSAGWGSISIVQAIRELPKVLFTYTRIKRALRRLPPGVFVPIDFGYANIRLCRAAKAAGWKILYLIPPGSWRKDRQGKDVAVLADLIVTNFPWSADLLTQAGAKAHFFGHPLKQLLGDHQETSRSGVAVLLGSRRSEIEQLLPIVQAALPRGMRARLPVPPEHLEWVRGRWKRPGDEIVRGDEPGRVAQVLRTSEIGVICSGTASLEAALARLPCVIVYRVSKLVQLEARLIGFKKPRFISQPNLLMEQEVVKELVQDDLTAQALTSELERLRRPDVQVELKKRFEELDALLGAGDALTQTAHAALGLLRSN